MPHAGDRSADCLHSDNDGHEWQSASGEVPSNLRNRQTGVAPPRRPAVTKRRYSNAAPVTKRRYSNGAPVTKRRFSNAITATKRRFSNAVTVTKRRFSNGAVTIRHEFTADESKGETCPQKSAAKGATPRAAPE